MSCSTDSTGFGECGRGGEEEVPVISDQLSVE